ncbi:MAG TPA: hypothetical protein QF528_01800 [Phycisphaerales bacterium]|jgi:hypothetical protein|nr:hypothetical protein [Phycisphaerales bacterium]|tara:strand:+ start:978 stop:1685 length:708 start_codon:yes stop_codon:yes gene_type:complete
MSVNTHNEVRPRIYDGDGDTLMEADRQANRLVIMPVGDPRKGSHCRERIRIQWGQFLLNDMLTRRYRTLICGVNPVDNSHGIISALAEALPTSQWDAESITKYAKGYAEVSPDKVLVLKYDMDDVKVFALLRPLNQDNFTLRNLYKGFEKVAEMTETRWDRMPMASVSFLGGKSNRLVDENGNEPSFESTLRTMHEAGYRGDVYPSLRMWELAPTGVFATFPFPTSLKVMREGGF